MYISSSLKATKVNIMVSSKLEGSSSAKFDKGFVSFVKHETET